jgi:hypothetical protein
MRRVRETGGKFSFNNGASLLRLVKCVADARCKCRSNLVVTMVNGRHQDGATAGLEGSQAHCKQFHCIMNHTPNSVHSGAETAAHEDQQCIVYRSQDTWSGRLGDGPLWVAILEQRLAVVGSQRR